MLEKKTYKILKYIYKKKQVTYEEIQAMTNHDEINGQSKYISCLMSNKFVDIWESEEITVIGGLNCHESIGFKITLAGSAYIEQKRRDSRLFWVPYTITTIVAIAGLLVAIAGLLREDQSFGNRGMKNSFHSQEQTYALESVEK